MKSGAGPILHATSTEHAGTMAMWEGLHRISKFWHLRFASKINSQEINLSALGGIIMDLKDLLFSIRFSRVLFCSRSKNGVAHRLAGIGSLLDQIVTYMAVYI